MVPHSSALAWKIPWTEEPGRLKSMGSLSQTRLRDFTFTFHFHALEKEMATHSSVLTWRIPGMGEPGGLPSMGSRRVGHYWSDSAAAAAAAAAMSIRMTLWGNFSIDKSSMLSKNLTRPSSQTLSHLLPWWTQDLLRHSLSSVTFQGTSRRWFTQTLGYYSGRVEPCCTTRPWWGLPLVGFLVWNKRRSGTGLGHSCSHESTISEFRKLLCSNRLSSQLVKWRQTESIIIILCSCGAFSAKVTVFLYFLH